MNHVEAKDFEGTVIHGTLQPRDLVPAFLDVAYQLIEAHDRGPRHRYPMVLNHYSRWTLSSVFHRYHAAKHLERAEAWCNENLEMLEFLFQFLDDIAPEGMYFGAHPGDGSDFGFWRYDDASE
jgi:hypothetical protein